ncbi:MAG: hypothetical protein C4B58_13475 [Deltaproteobacteria bacterium]|nr:MAG: hypothetical protein C4B58_13475 [Deltaproteobacteria bacterium]
MQSDLQRKKLHFYVLQLVDFIVFFKLPGLIEKLRRFPWIYTDMEQDFQTTSFSALYFSLHFHETEQIMCYK